MNPLVQREFFGILRSPKTFATLLLLTTAFSLAVLMRWPSDAKVDLSGAQSIGVFRVFGYGLLAGVIFLVPAFPASSIVKEKNKGTLALLLNSPLQPASIYFGKLAGVLLFSLLVLLASLPAAAACFAMGGVDLVGGLGLLYLILALLVVQYATLGMMVSSLVQSADSGVRVTYGIVLGLCLLTLIPHAFFQGENGFLPLFAQWLRYFSPLPVIMRLMGHGSVASRGLMENSSGTLEFVGLTIMTWFVFGAVTLSRLNHRIFDRARAQGVMTDDRELASRLARRMFYVVDPQRRKAGIPWYLNPVMVKEFRCRRFGRIQWLLRLVAVCALTSMVLTFLASTSVKSWGVETIGGLMVFLQVILVIVLTPSLAAGLISGERDSGGWELLRMTPISPWKIMSGKLLSVVWTLLLVLMATLPGYVVMIYIKPDMALQVNKVLICLAWTAVYTLSVSAAVGSLFRNTAIATTTTYVTVMSLFLVPMLVWLGRDAPFGHDTVQLALLINPVGAALSVIEAPGFSSYNLLPAAWWVAGIVSSFMFLAFGVQVWRLTRPV
jgi:ABC-type transport system involved in multi-copper enzyme maturation permease subunit